MALSRATGVESLSRRGGVHSSAVKLRAEGVRFTAEAVSLAKCSGEGPRFAAEAFSTVRKSKFALLGFHRHHHFTA